MRHPNLKDSTILVVEDEPLISMDISMAFKKSGAHITSTNTIKHARLLVEHDGLSAVILDHALPDGDSTILCERLMQLGIPFLMYSGYATVEGPCAGSPHLQKPASHEQILDAMEVLIRDGGRHFIAPHTGVYINGDTDMPWAVRSHDADGVHCYRFDDGAKLETTADRSRVETILAHSRRIGEKP